ncbi:MAG TPA: NUDIX domain-containing protein [Pyrodictium delaneyi]|uniref:NUDIX domain-containing protein n=1 Tax=Pyrodictium delaneyi TaxID=1273541 RepID=A0A832ZSU0_9CREN|nr:NUDIX domain-containing protein [Pyrodictium delaneyi]
MLFRVTARCIIMRDGLILVQLSKKGDFYRLPGGRVRPEETVLQGLQRELREELGISNISEAKLAFIVESFYRRRSGIVHEIGFYFICRLGDAEIKPREEHLKLRWVRPDELDVNNFRPSALAKYLRRLHDGGDVYPQYIINVDVGRI